MAQGGIHLWQDLEVRPPDPAEHSEKGILWIETQSSKKCPV